MIADIELQQEVFPPFFYHLSNDVELMPVELDVGYFRQVVERHAVNHLPVIERADGYL